MKRFWTVSKILVIIFYIIISAGVPFIINEAYKVNDGYITLWGAKEVFGFWGDVVGAGATVLALIYTIMYTEFQRRSERKASCKPYLTTVWDSWDMKAVEEKPWDCDMAIVLEKDKELYATTYIPPIIKDVRVFDYVDMSKLSESNYDNFEGIKNRAKRKISDDYIVIEYLIKNVGVGTAIESKLYINNQEMLPPFAIVPKETLKIFMIYNMRSLAKNDTWNVEVLFVYSDVYKDSTLTQRETMCVTRNEKGELSLVQEFGNKLSMPEEK